MLIRGVEDVREAVGRELGPGPWWTVEQSDVDTFAELSDDHQWIHVDPERAAAGPYGATVAHGLLTLAILPRLIGPLRRFDGVRMGLNYGYNRVRFPDALRVGSRVRGRLTMVDVTETSDDGITIESRITVEAEGRLKPCLAAEHLMRVYFA